MSTTSIDPASGKKWMHAIGLDMAAECEGISQGKKPPLDMDLAPRGQIVENKRSSFPDIWLGQGGLLSIRPALRDRIDAHDPGRHYIWPMTHLTERGVQYDGEFFAFVPAVHASAMAARGRYGTRGRRPQHAAAKAA
jgi:hypothetical protein